MVEAVVISHLVKPPTRAATLLIAEHGAATAHKRALRELRNFWATVIAEIDAHCAMGFATVR